MTELLFWLIVAALAALLVWLVVPIWAMKSFNLANGKEQAEVQDNYRKTVGQAVGAIAIIVTFAWTFTKDRETLDQARDQFRAQAEQFKEQQQQARRQSANQQFLAAALLLKEEESVGTRTAGLYGMQQVTLDQADYRLPAIYAALAVIRQAASKLPSPDSGWPPVRDDTQSAIAVLATLNAGGDVRVMLDDSYLVRADFSSASQPSKAFVHSSFQGARVYGARFNGLNLEHTEFGGAYMADWEAYGEHWDELSRENYENIQSRLVVDFSGARLAGARFDHTNIGGGIFKGACLAAAAFWHSDLSRANFTNANLGQTSSCDLSGKKAHFYQATLIETDFTGVDVGGINFDEANLSKANFSKALNVEKASFRGACAYAKPELPPSVKIEFPPCQRL